MTQFSLSDWQRERARVAQLLAAGSVDHAEGRAQLAVLDAQIARMAAAKPAGVYHYRPASQRAGGYLAFLNRFARGTQGAVDVGNGGLITTDDEGSTELRLYGPIGSGFGIGPKDVAGALDEHDVTRVRLNSPGGDVFDGVAIAGMVERAGLPVIVDGVAASIASVIAAASPNVTMMRGAFLFIHRAWTAPVGHADELRKEAAVLDKLDAQMSALYARKAGGDAKEWFARMSAETWLSAEESVAFGLADENADDDETGIVTARGFDLSAYHRNVPQALRRVVA